MRDVLPFPLVIPGEPVTRVNRTIDYRVKNMHPSKIKNPRLAAAKRLWDESNCYRDVVMWTVKAFCRTHSIAPIPKDTGVLVDLTIYFKAKNPNPATCRLDIDNILKLYLDAIEKSGLIQNDKQVTDLVVRKRVSPDKPCCVINRIAF